MIYEKSYFFLISAFCQPPFIIRHPPSAIRSAFYRDPYNPFVLTVHLQTLALREEYNNKARPNMTVPAWEKYHNSGEPHTHWKLTDPFFWFFMDIMTSGMVHGRVHPSDDNYVAPAWQPNSRSRFKVMVNVSLHLWYWTFMSWSIDSCQNKISSDQYHMTISRAHK